MLDLLLVQFFTIMMFLLFGMLIRYKKTYSLISGFGNRPEEEQKQLIENGYPQAVGKMMFHISYILIAGLLLHMVQVPNAVYYSWIVLIVYMFGYLFYISKLDETRSSKKHKVILMITMVFTFALLIVVFSLGSIENELTVSDEYVHVSGMYGIEWPLVELTKMELVEELPKVEIRTNGYALGDRMKGNFRLEGLGRGKLFLYRDNPPFIYIEKGNEYIFINSKDVTKTLQWFEELRESNQ